MKLREGFELLATAPDGVARLRELVLSLAVQGKLVPQDATEESASGLHSRISAEMDRATDSRRARNKPVPPVTDGEAPFELPQGWIWVRFGEICPYIQRGKGPRYADKSEFPVISQKCVRWYGLDIEQARYIDPASLSAYDDVRFLRPGDILWNSTGTGTIGRATFVPDGLPYPKLVADSHVTVIRPLLVSPSYIWRWIQSPFVQSEINGLASGSTNQIELATSTVISHLLPLPPLDEQVRIVAKVDELMQLCDELESSGRLESEQHSHLTTTLFEALAASESAHALAENWSRVAANFDLLLDRPEAVDALEQTILQLAVRGLLVKQNPADVPASKLLEQLRATGSFDLKEKKKRSSGPENDVQMKFAVPHGWEWTHFGVVVDSLNGYAFKSEWFKPHGVRLVRNVNVSHGRIEWQQVAHVDAEKAEECARFALEAGDIVLSLDRPIISTGLKYAEIVEADLPCLLLQRVAKLAPRAGAVTREFLKVWMASPDFTEAIDPGRSNGVPHISTKQLEAIPFALPPVEEQGRIVVRVAQLRRLCADLRARLTERQTCQARFAEALIEQTAAASPDAGRLALAA